MTEIIVVEDDTAIADILVYNLQDIGYHVHHIGDGLEARNYLLNEQSYDLVILDIMLPNYSGLDICRELRQQRPEIPILMLTSMGDEIDRVLGLEFGADDYMTKPYGMRELQARVKALLRRCLLSKQTLDVKNPEHTVLIFEELHIDIDRREVRLAEQLVELTAKEFDLLLFLASHAGKVYSRAHLLDEVWDYHYDGYEHTVNTHINRLRNKLKRADNKPDFVQTKWGVGYKFLA